MNTHDTKEDVMTIDELHVIVDEAFEGIDQSEVLWEVRLFEVIGKRLAENWTNRSHAQSEITDDRPLLDLASAS